MRVIAINIARILVTLCVIVGFSAATPAAYAAPKEQTEVTESVPPTAPVHDAPVKVLDDIPSHRILMDYDHTEVPRVLFLGICLDFYYCLRRVLVPKFGFHFDRGSVSQALVKPRLVPP